MVWRLRFVIASSFLARAGFLLHFGSLLPFYSFGIFHFQLLWSWLGSGSLGSLHSWVLISLSLGSLYTLVSGFNLTFAFLLVSFITFAFFFFIMSLSLGF